MRVFLTGASGHNGSHVVSELVATGHEVTGLARSDAAAAAVSALGDALTGTGKPLVAAASIGAPGNLGRPVTEDDPAVPSKEEDAGTFRRRNDVEIAVLGFAERGVRSSVVRLPPISHGTRDRTGFLAQLIAIAKDKGVAGYSGDGANRRVPRDAGQAGLPGVQPHHPPGPRLGTGQPRPVRRPRQRPLLRHAPGDPLTADPGPIGYNSSAMTVAPPPAPSSPWSAVMVAVPSRAAVRSG